jgi:transposase
MNPYPEMRSTFVLDNCRIHHNEALLQLVQAFGCHILFLPAYSPDLNPIEESFSACKYNFPLVCISVLNPDAL